MGSVNKIPGNPVRDHLTVFNANGRAAQCCSVKMDARRHVHRSFD